MCEFVSWVEHEDKLYYLTANLLNTKEGRNLKKHLGAQYTEDIKGHGAIERYFGIKGKHHECTDFSSPKNFPDEIIKAMKAGAFRGIGIPDASRVLTKKAYADYRSKRDALYDDYRSKLAPLDDDYESKCAALYDDYRSKRDALDDDHRSKRAALYDDYKSKRAPLDDDYESKCAALYDDYRSKRDALDDDYESKCAALYADYQYKRADLFWDIFMDKKNRAKAWK